MQPTHLSLVAEAWMEPFTVLQALTWFMSAGCWVGASLVRPKSQRVIDSQQISSSIPSAQYGVAAASVKLMCSGLVTKVVLNWR